MTSLLPSVGFEVSREDRNSYPWLSGPPQAFLGRRRGSTQGMDEELALSGVSLPNAPGRRPPGGLGLDAPERPIRLVRALGRGSVKRIPGLAEPGHAVSLSRPRAATRKARGNVYRELPGGGVAAPASRACTEVALPNHRPGITDSSVAGQLASIAGGVALAVREFFHSCLLARACACQGPCRGWRCDVSEEAGELSEWC